MAIQTKGLDQVLVDEKILTKEQAEAVLINMQEKGGSIGAAAARLGFCAEDAVARMIATVRGTKYIDLGAARPEVMEQFAKLVPADVAHKHRAIPVNKFRDRLTFAVADPAEPSLIRLSDDFFRGRPGQVELVVSCETMITAALEKYFPHVTKKAATAAAASSAQSMDSVLGEVGAIKMAEGPDGSAPAVSVASFAPRRSRARGGSTASVSPTRTTSSPGSRAR